MAMKARLHLFLFLLLGTAYSLTAQSIYHFQYHFANDNDSDSTIYDAFLVRYEDGTGLIRVRYFNDETRQSILVDMDMQEGYQVDPSGRVDSSQLYFEGIDPVIIEGDTSLPYDPDIFWFRLDNNTGYFEPWGIVSPDEKGTPHYGEFITSRLLGEKDLTKDFVGIFFSDGEEFFQNTAEEETATVRALPAEDKKTKLFLVIAANTLDEDIGTTCEQDKLNTEKTFTDLAEFMGIELVPPKIIAGKDFTKKNVDVAIESLNPSKKDIVVFYYSGHGFSMPDNFKYPHVALTAKSFESVKANSLNMEDIFSRIQNKGARFNLVVSDCCNSGDENASAVVPGEFVRIRPSHPEWDLDNCKALFLDKKPMSILMTAASRGEYSCGVPRLGGLFTSSFRSTLLGYFNKFHKTVSWDMILVEAKNQTIKKAEATPYRLPDGTAAKCKQIPIFTIKKG
jgi:Caspase domain